MKHIFECYESVQKYAILEFNQNRRELEGMYQSKIKVNKMFWCFGWKVEFELISEDTKNAKNI